MAEELTEVEPGQIITAEAWNAMVRRLREVETTGNWAVPSVFGQKLKEARATVQAASGQLTVGSVLDAFGSSFHEADSTVQDQRVLGQTPSAGMRVPTGSSVNLVIAAKPTSGGGTPQVTPVTIAKFFVDNVELTGSAAVAIKKTLQINGTGFSQVLSENKITIGGTQVQALSNSNDKNLFVLVPESLPGAPTSGQPPKEYTVVVTVNGQEATKKLLVAPPLPGTPPAITSVVGEAPGGDALVIVGRTATITGSGFGTDAAQVKVRFGSTNVAHTLVNATTITLTTPALGVPVGNTQIFQVVIEVGSGATALSSPPFQVRVRNTAP